jgi:hypothetical protein
MNKIGWVVMACSHLNLRYEPTPDFCKTNSAGEIAMVTMPMDATSKAIFQGDSSNVLTAAVHGLSSGIASLARLFAAPGAP